MKICITALNDKLDSQIDSRFGRAAFFIVLNTETGEWRSIKNENADGMGGVGIKAAELMAENDVEWVLSGHFGPNAFDTLQKAGIQMVSEIRGTAQEVWEQFKRGEFSSQTGPNVPSKSGLV